MAIASGAGSRDYERGQEAAALLWQRWRDRPKVDDPRTPAFAAGAISELVELQHRSPDVDKEMRYYAEAAAEQLTADPFHGVLEVLQNADDLGARALWLSVKKGKATELLAAHDGRPVQLPDVIALTFAFLSTKRHDPRAKGRFGIGLKTLNQMGGRLEVHSPPYHFQIDRGTIAASTPAPILKGVYAGTDDRTLFRLRLDPDVSPEGLRAWIELLDARQLLFLDSVRAIHLVDTRTGVSRKSTTISIRARPSVDLVLRPGVVMKADRALISEGGPQGGSWERYSIEYPVPADQKRAHKQTGETTPLAVCVPSGPTPSVIAAGLPLGIRTSLPFSLNAQFDPESSRRSITHRKWNEWLFARLADLVGAVAVARFADEPAGGWQVVPLISETEAEDSWLSDQLAALATAVQTRVEKSARVGGAPLDSLAYESPALERVLTENDIEHLSEGRIALKRAWRSSDIRWRGVLEDIGTAQLIDAATALDLLNDDTLMAGRSTRWFVRFVDAALAEDLQDDLLGVRCILTADGERLAPASGVLLVRRMDRRGLAARLGLARPVAAPYTERTAPKRVKDWLSAKKLLAEAPDAAGALAALSRLPEDAPIDLDDDGLRLVRDALDEVEDSQRRALGLAIGRRVRVRGFHWVDGKRERLSVSPAKSYLPSTISKETRGWPQAAAQTARLEWIDSHYLGVLKKPGREEAGARRFFVALGAEVAPRLIAVGSAQQPLRIPSDLPTRQQEALARARQATHLAKDWRSPDLDGVLADIARQRADRKRRSRARALFETLTQHWDRMSYAAETQAVWHYYTWRHLGLIPATWIARAAGASWLSNKKGRKAAPQELAIDTPLTRLTRGNDPAQFVHELDEGDAGSPLVTALGIKGTAPASELVNELASIRDHHGAEATEPDVRPHYQALAALCRAAGTRDEIGDMTRTELRRSFGVGRGLILTDGGWTTPRDVRLGRPIFGKRRCVVSENSLATPLWRALGIAHSSADDCLSVLGEIAGGGGVPSDTDRAVIVDTLRYLADLEPTLRGGNRRRLARFPLWTSRGWVTTGEVIAVEDRSLQAELGKHVAVWLPGCSLRTLRGIPRARGLKIIEDSALGIETTSAADSSAASEMTKHLYRAALQHLENMLAESEPVLWGHGDWPGLAALELLESANLTVSVRIGRRSVTIPRDVHLDGRDRLCFRSEEELSEPEVGGRAIASFFPQDAREIVAFAWSHAWRRADREGPPDAPLRLAVEAEEGDGLATLAASAGKTGGRRLFGGGAVRARQEVARRPPIRPAPRVLKDFTAAVVGTVRIEGGPPPAAKVGKKRTRLVDPPAKPQSELTKPPRALRDWTELEKETRGFELLAAALKTIDGADLEDFRAIRNIGADSIDNLRRYFELKVHLGSLPDEITLEPSEFERAATEEGSGSYYLAVIGGLEEGARTELRIFAHPLRTLRWKRTSTIRLSGVHTARALIIPIEDPPPGD